MIENPSDNELAFLKAIEGKWQYQCTVSSSIQFPDEKGRKCHGGICELKVVRNAMTTEVLVTGQREWYCDNPMPLEKRKDRNKKLISNPTQWNSVKGAFISNCEFMYQYHVGNEGVSGITFVRFCTEEGNLPSPGHFKGEFFYLPQYELSALGIEGGAYRDVMNPSDISERIIKDKRRQKWLKVHGELEMKKI